MPGHAPMEQCEGLRASVEPRSLASTTPSDDGMPVFSTLAGPGSETGSGAGAEILARQRWHREYIAFFCDSVPVYIIASPTCTLYVRCCAAEAERRLQPARLRGELAATFFEDGIKKSSPKPHQMDCPVGWVRQVEAAECPGAFRRRLGHLIRGGRFLHGTMWLRHGRCRSVLRLRRSPNFGSTWSGVLQNGCIKF